MNSCEAIGLLLNRHKASLKGNDAAFLERVYSKGIDVYVDRVKQYGFCGLSTVLDAGCGFGQWALALSAVNLQVSACDASKNRLEVLIGLAADLGVDNLSVQQASLDTLPYDSASFDGVFCYGVLFLTHWRESLRELARLVCPGGKLYVNANGIGWYKNLWYNLPNPAADYDPQLVAARAFMNTWKYQNGQSSDDGVDIIIEPEQLKAELKKLGFDHIAQASEGLLYASHLEGATHRAFFKGEYLGDLGVYEMIGIKHG